MKNYISIVKTMIWLVFLSLIGFACNSTAGSEQAKHQELRKAAQAPVASQQNHPELPEAELAKEQVCMVNNAYMGKKQIPVAFENKTYYGCCEMCVEKIKTNKAVRYATDPQTGKEVDKATAFIVLDPKSKDGAVLYFESEESYKKYKSPSPLQLMILMN